MVRIMKSRRIWLVALCGVAAAVGLFYGWQHTYAQPPDLSGPPPPPPGMGPPPPPPPGYGPSGGVAGPVQMPGMQSGAAAAPARPAAPPEPTFSLKSMLPPHVKVIKNKNWDGTVTELLQFKHKTMDGRTISVRLPAVYKEQKKTKGAWKTLFVVFGMDYEDQLDKIERSQPPDVSAYMDRLMAEIRGQVPSGPAPRVAAEAIEKAKSYLPSMGIGAVTLPPLLPFTP